MLGVRELDELLDDIRRRVVEANRRGTLEELLTRMGMNDLIAPQKQFDSYRDGKIVVLGESEIKEDMMKIIAGKAGIDKSRFEFCLGYDNVKRYNFKKLQYAPSYRLVMVGSMPHKTEGTSDSSSVIAEMENNAGYPRVVRLTANGQFKITKNNFRQSLEALCSEGYK